MSTTRVDIKESGSAQSFLSTLFLLQRQKEQQVQVFDSTRSDGNFALLDLLINNPNPTRINIPGTDNSGILTEDETGVSVAKEISLGDRIQDGLETIQDALPETVKGIFGITTSDDLPGISEDRAFAMAIEHIKLREGYENEAYYDTEGKLTIGVGHLVTDEDAAKLGLSSISEGTEISDTQVEMLLQDDAMEAFQAAQEQMRELGIQDEQFLVALTSVNFQLGTAWNQEHVKTWGLMKQGRFDEAATEVANSLWNEQTPVRVQDMQAALIDVDRNTATSFT